MLLALIFRTLKQNERMKQIGMFVLKECVSKWWQASFEKYGRLEKKKDLFVCDKIER